MKLTNRLNLPQPLVDAVRNDSYSKGSGVAISATSLLKPPRLLALETQHEADLEEDASSRIWSLMGQVVHGILERADKTGIAERRLSIEVEGWRVSGQMDRYIDGTLQDYKVVTVYKFKDGKVPEEYEQQLNIYAHILRTNGHAVSKLQIVGILRDWSKMESRRDPSYPQTQVIVRDVPLWEADRAERFVRERVILHQQSRVTLPECSVEDRWAKPTQYALMKVGGKRAVKLYDSEADALAHASIDPKNLRVEVRPGVSTRCEAYCAVAKFCTQYKNTLNASEQAQVESKEEIVA